MTATPETIQLPGGGTATFRPMSALPPRQKRRIKPYIIALSARLDAITNATSITVDGKVAARDDRLLGEAMSMTIAEANLFTDMQDQTTLALLATWSLPFPKPDTLDDLLDVDDVTGQPGVYDALSAQSAKLAAEVVGANGFTVDSVEDLDSPTGA